MGIFDPQGLPSSPTSQASTTSGIASWAQPYVMNYLNQGNALLNQGPTDLQKQVYGASAGMQTPGQFAQGSDFLNKSGAGMLGTTGTALGYGAQGSNYGAQGAAYGAQGATAGQEYQNMATDPSQMAAYMNPFIQQALNPQLALLNQQQALQGQGIAAKAAGQGAFGGNRAALSQGLNAQNYALAGQQAMGQAYTDAFKQAQQAQQFRADLGLRGLQAAMQGAGLGIQGAQTGLQGVQGAQAGYAGATQAGVGLGNIGAQQGQYDISRLGLQNQIANQQYNLPFQRLNFMQGLMSGLPISTATTQGYQAGPNKLSQLTGAVGALGSYAPGIINYAKDLYKSWNSNDGYGAGDAYSNMTPDEISNMQEHGVASGGQITDSGVKRYAEGGITSINRRVMNDPTAYSPETIDRGAQNNVLGGVTKLLALDTIAKQRAAMQNQQAMMQQPSPSVMAQLQQQAMMQQQMVPGIDNAESNLPQQYAGGGIIAFEEGGNVPRFQVGGINWFGRADKTNEDEKRSAFKEDIEAFSKNTKEKIQIPDWLKDIGNYFTKPRQAPTDADAQPGGYYGSGSNVPPVAQAKPDSGIVIHPTAPRTSATSSPVVSPTSTYKPAETSGIDNLIKGYESMIRGGEDFKKAESDADRSAFRKTMLGMMAGESPYFFTNLGKAGMASQEGLDKTLEGIQARKDKQITQLMGLGLKGEDLKNEAKKLGISETELQAKLPMYSAAATKDLATAKYISSGKGGAGTKGLGGATAYKVMQEFKGYKADPKSAPFFNQLPKNVRTGLTDYPVGSTSYNNALQEFNRIADQEMLNEIGTLRALGAGSSSSAD